MSLDSRGGWLQDVRLDVAGAVLGLILALALLPLRFVASQVHVETLPIVIAAACLLYLLAVRNEGIAGMGYFSSGVARLLPSVSVFGMAVMVFAAATGGRSGFFFAVAAVVATLIFAQILLVAEEDFHRGILLGQVLCFGLALRLAGLHATPGYIGVDVWSHVPNWSRKIMESGSLAPIADRKYYASPLFHLLVVSASMLFDVSLRTATHLTIGLAMGLSVVLVYATTSLFTSSRWAVFATALFTASASVIEWGLSLFPTSLGLVFFLGILYCLTRILYTDYGATDFLLVVFFSVAVILTHQISSFIMLVFVGSSLLAKLLLRFEFLRPERSSAIYFSPQDTVNVTGLLVFDLGLITFMWSLTPYHGASFLETTFNFFHDTVTTSGGFLNLASADAAAGGGTQPGLLASIVRYTDVLGFLVLFALTILGSLYLLRRQNVSHAGVTAIISVVAMLAFVFGFPLFGVRTFVPGRWFAFIAAPMVVLGAIGLGFLSEEASPRLVLALVLVVVLIFPAVSMTAADAVVDDPVFDSVQTRYGYSERELAAVETIGVIAPESELSVHTDHPYATVFVRTEAHEAGEITLVDGAPTDDTVVWRSYQGTGAAYFLDGSENPHQPAVSRAQLCGGRDVTYTNGDVAMCSTPPG